MDIYILYIFTIINTTNMYSQILQNYTRGGKQIGLILVKKKKKKQQTLKSTSPRNELLRAP